jgi:hypothetical protein
LTFGKVYRIPFRMSEPAIPTVEVANRLGRTVRQVHYLIEAGRLTPTMKGNGPRGPMFFDADAVHELACELDAETVAS